MTTRRDALLSIPAALCIPAQPPTDSDIERVAKEMYFVAHNEAADSDPDAGWNWRWNHISGSYRAGWIALAKWHLERLRT